MKKPTYC